MLQSMKSTIAFAPVVPLGSLCAEASSVSDGASGSTLACRALMLMQAPQKALSSSCVHSITHYWAPAMLQNLMTVDIATA